MGAPPPGGGSNPPPPDELLQRKINFLLFLPCCTAFLSIVGSTLTLVSIYRTRKCNSLKIDNNNNNTSPASTNLTTYHRLFIGISISDIISSIGLGLGPIPIPSTTHFKGAFGNVATCSFQGFIQTLGLASFAYSDMLMIYYLMVIKYNISNTTIQQYRIEYVLHFIPISFYLTISIVGLVQQLYNPAGPFSCWISVYPMNCMNNPEVECIRGGINGEQATLFRDYFIMMPLIVWTILSLSILLVVAYTVIVQYRKSQRFFFERRYCHNNHQNGQDGRNSSMLMSIMMVKRKNDTNNSNTINNNDSNETIASATPTPTATSTASNTLSRTTRQVIVQCLLYGLVITNSLLWRTMRTMFTWADKPYDFFGQHYWITFLGVFFFPLQGLFNFIIFIRQRYLNLRRQERPGRRQRRQNGDDEEIALPLSRWKAFQYAIWYPLHTSSSSFAVAGRSSGRSSGSDNNRSRRRLRFLRSGVGGEGGNESGGGVGGDVASCEDADVDDDGITGSSSNFFSIPIPPQRSNNNNNDTREMKSDADDNNEVEEEKKKQQRVDENEVMDEIPESPAIQQQRQEQDDRLEQQHEQ